MKVTIVDAEEPTSFSSVVNMLGCIATGILITVWWNKTGHFSDPTGKLLFVPAVCFACYIANKISWFLCCVSLALLSATLFFSWVFDKPFLSDIIKSFH